MEPVQVFTRHARRAGPMSGAGPSSLTVDVPSSPRASVTAAALAQREQAIRFVLRGAWVRKFKRQGKVGAPHMVFLQCKADALTPTVKWGGRREAVVGVDGGLFGDEFLGDSYFDKHHADEALCFSLRLAGRTLFFLALNEVERDRWVQGLHALISEWTGAATAEERSHQLLREQSERSNSSSLSTPRGRSRMALSLGGVSSLSNSSDSGQVLSSPRRMLTRALSRGTPQSARQAPATPVAIPPQPASAGVTSRTNLHELDESSFAAALRLELPDTDELTIERIHSMTTPRNLDHRRRSTSGYL